jgi:hypothetical protein
MEGEINLRKLIIYGGVILIALTTILAVVANSGSFLAREAEEGTTNNLIEPCLEEADPGDAAQSEECGGSGGSEEPPICVEPVPVEGETTLSSIPEECDDVCYLDEQFPPAHDAATETAQQAAVTKADGDGQSRLDAELRRLANDVNSQYFTPLKRLLRFFNGRDPQNEAEARMIINTFYSNLSDAFNDPVNFAKIQAEVLDPVTLFEKSVYEALTLPKQDKHYRGDPHDTSRDREWQLFSNFRPQFEGWPTSLSLTGIKFKALNVTGSSGSYTLCVPGSLGIANGNWNFNIDGIDAKGRWSNPNGALEITAGVNMRGQARLGLFGSFRF